MPKKISKSLDEKMGNRMWRGFLQTAKNWILSINDPKERLFSLTRLAPPPHPRRLVMWQSTDLKFRVNQYLCEEYKKWLLNRLALSTNRLSGTVGGSISLLCCNCGRWSDLEELRKRAFTCIYFILVSLFGPRLRPFAAVALVGCKQAECKPPSLSLVFFSLFLPSSYLLSACVHL